MGLKYASFYFDIGSYFLSHAHVLLKFHDLFRSHVPSLYKVSLPSHSYTVPSSILHIEIENSYWLLCSVPVPKSELAPLVFAFSRICT